MKKNDPVKNELIETLVSRIARSAYMNSCFKVSTREESVRDIVTTILDQYNVTEVPAKGPATTPGMVDITKKSNCKCEHCEHWNKNTRICDITQGSKYYYQRCKKFEWAKNLDFKPAKPDNSVDFATLPVGTMFYVINGNWHGSIFERDGKKYLHIDETNEDGLVVPDVEHWIKILGRRRNG